MSEFTEEPRFTIEQIDLLQRLQRSGMSRREILHAVDTLERLDREHGDKFGRRASSSSSSSSSCNNNNHINGTDAGLNGAEGGAGPSPSARMSAATQTLFRPASASTTAAATTAATLSPSPSNSFDPSPPPGPPPAPAPVPSSPVAMATLALNGRDGPANGKLSPQRYGLHGALGGRVFGFDAAVGDEDLEVDDRVEELMRRDSGLVKEEIKAFLGNRRISQAVVAQVTGISQSRISHWLLQHGSDLSATLNMRPAPLALEEMEWRQTPPPISSAPGAFRLRRGSRFTWRKDYFNDNQYPDEAKREEVANACNAVIQKPGRKLSDLERVTSLKVYNWFANRRKEIKRRANIEATILESHGIDVQSPGGHSNSDDIDGNDFSEQACDLPYFDKRPLSRQFGYYRLEPNSPTQDDGTGASEPQDPISLAVEMAAVNHTILALSRGGEAGGVGAAGAGGAGVVGGGGGGGGGGEIKTETLEEE
ncbi:hypothetical protein NHX12_026034 [Muraenolepis orangiensis]|uniref:Homeobox-containing protein 1 n=1 Tax=Muraenolepis orangiensis TaxID=630683 RepID=A0A9Q0EJ38_9TELE|nr:hypothetical protein NHX12_026034 [Muraenolepis orangiensis]